MEITYFIAGVILGIYMVPWCFNFLIHLSITKPLSYRGITGPGFFIVHIIAILIRSFFWPFVAKDWVKGALDMMNNETVMAEIEKEVNK